MKKFISIGATVLLLSSAFIFAGAQTANSMKSLPASEATAPEPASVQFLISIPDEFTSHIIRENGQDAVYFKFKGSNGGTDFLFQVSRISELQWLQVKSQLAHPVILDHKNGFIYYSIRTNKSHIKGPDSKTYDEIYGRLQQLINSIVITEVGNG